MRRKDIKSLSFYSVLFFGLLSLTGGCSNRPSEIYSLEKVIGQEGEVGGQFREPIGIAIDRQGFVYVSDSGNNRIHKFSPEGKFIKMWGRKGEMAGELNRPMHISSGPDGYLYVAEYLNDRISVFDKEGKFIRFIGIKESGTSYFDAPGGADVDKEGDVYAADFYHHKIEKFNSQGKILRTIGMHGIIRAGKLNYPTDVEIDSSGNLYVADAYNNRIQKFTPEGDFLARWGGPSGLGIPFHKPGFFKVAAGITLDSKGNLYVSDFYNNRVQKLSPEGKVLAVIGALVLKYPTDAAVDRRGGVWVVDFGNNRVVKFKLRRY